MNTAMWAGLLRNSCSELNGPTSAAFWERERWRKRERESEREPDLHPGS